MIFSFRQIHITSPLSSSSDSCYGKPIRQRFSLSTLSNWITLGAEILGNYAFQDQPLLVALGLYYFLDLFKQRLLRSVSNSETTQICFREAFGADAETIDIHLDYLFWGLRVMTPRVINSSRACAHSCPWTLSPETIALRDRETAKARTYFFSAARLTFEAYHMVKFVGNIISYLYMTFNKGFAGWPQL